MNIKMQWLLLAIILLASFCSLHKCHADSLELLGGGLVYHPADSGLEDHYANRLNQSTVSPALYGIRYNFDDANTYTALSVLGGQDSFGKRILGGFFSVGRSLRYLNLGILAGAYGRTLRPAIDSDREPTFIPMMGLEFNLKIPFSESVAMKLNTMASFQLVSGILGLEIRI